MIFITWGFVVLAAWGLVRGGAEIEREANREVESSLVTPEITNG
jgi:hypothetical protein